MLFYTMFFIAMPTPIDCNKICKVKHDKCLHECSVDKDDEICGDICSDEWWKCVKKCRKK